MLGDQVTAYDPKTGKATTQTVQQTFINHDTGLLDVTLRVVQAATSASPTTPVLDPSHKQRLAAVASHASHAPPTATTATSSPSTSGEMDAQLGDETIHTTASHPWLSADHGWIVEGQVQCVTAT